MKQKTFDLTEQQLARLTAESNRSGQGQAEIVRAALEMLFASRSTPYSTSQATSTAVPPAAGRPHQPGHQRGNQPGSARGGAMGGSSLAVASSSPRDTEPTERDLFPPVEEGSGGETPTRAAREKRPPAVLPAPPEEIAAVVGVWLAYKRDRGESYKSATGLRELYAKLSTWGAERAMVAVKHSMSSNWAGVFEPNGNGRASPQRSAGSDAGRDQQYAAAGIEWTAPDLEEKP